MITPLNPGDIVLIKKPILRKSYAGISWDARVMGRYIAEQAQVHNVYPLASRYDAYILSINRRVLQFGGEPILWIPHWLDLLKSAPPQTPAPNARAQALREIEQAQQRLTQAHTWLNTS